MARIRAIQIENFRGIQHLDWLPSPGINCLIGAGDSGKSSVIEAVDLCIGARRNVQITDADFHTLDTDKPISVSVTVGDLDDSLRSFEYYGQFLRGFDANSGIVSDEPATGAETVLTVELTVFDDLEPAWSLVSDRAAAQNIAKNLNWADRVRLAPTRIGGVADINLAWRRGSVLNRLTDEKADASAALIRAARDARMAFGDQAENQLAEALAIVGRKANELGIPLGGKAKAMLDAHAVSFSGGDIALHDNHGIPLRAMGLGSRRLLVAGLQREAAANAAIVLVDELEHGLEPHRIIRLLGSLGSKEKRPPLQVFASTHSPVVLRELSGDQIYVTRKEATAHKVTQVGTANDIQGTIRLYPDAFLSQRVVVCEGASEVGLLRGLDFWLTRSDADVSFTSRGVALVDAGGVDKLYKRANAFAALGYQTLVFRDDDAQPSADQEAAFKAAGGKVVVWRQGRAVEDEMFLSLQDRTVGRLIDRAVELHGEDLVAAHVRSASDGKLSLASCRAGLSPDSRAALAKASKTRTAGWFKSLSWMEDVAADIVGPEWNKGDPGFWSKINELFEWMHDGA